MQYLDKNQVLAFGTIDDELLLHSGKNTQGVGAVSLILELTWENFIYDLLLYSDLNERVLLGVFGVAIYTLVVFVLL